MGVSKGCERSGCGRPAGAALSVDPRRLIVWIGDLETSAAGVNRLCTPCADELRAPNGWERRDIREAPRLFAVAPTSHAEPAAAHALPESTQTETATATATTAATARPRSRARRNTVRGEAQLPVVAAVPELLEPSAETPLLARAFRGVRAAG